MAQIRNYQKGVFETKSLAKISQVTDSTNTFLQFDGILTNAFSNLVLYADAGGASPLPLTSYSSTTTDDTATALEAETSTGGSGYTVYSQFKVTDATYQSVDLYTTFTNFGTYTDNDAAFSQIGGAITISASGTIVPSAGYTRQIVTVDTSASAISLTVDPPEFIGQDIYILCDGAGLVDVDFDGKLAAGNIVISDKLMLRLTAKSLTEWSAVNEITANYISGSYTVVNTSAGKIKNTYRVAFTFAGNIFKSSLWTYVSAIINPKMTCSGGYITGIGGVFGYHFTLTTASVNVGASSYASISGTTVPMFFTVEGDY